MIEPQFSPKIVQKNAHGYWVRTIAVEREKMRRSMGRQPTDAEMVDHMMVRANQDWAKKELRAQWLVRIEMSKKYARSYSFP